MTTARTSWFDEIWPRVVVGSGIGYLATAYAVSRWLTRRSPARLEPPAHLDHLTFASMECRTKDNIILRGWSFEPDRPRGTVVLFHGLRGNRLVALPRIEFLTAAGYRCVAFDHRAHGESTGAWTSFGYFERHDVEAVADLVRTRWPAGPCAALGISMGGAALCFAAEKSRVFDAIVLQSVYHDLASTFQHRVGCEYPGWFKHFRKGIVWVTERRFGMRIREISPLAHVAKLAPRPVLLMTGSLDPHTPPHEMQLLADQLPETGRFEVIPDAGHEDVFEVGGLAYQQLILSFLDQHLCRRSAVVLDPLSAHR
jgi:uncharacterized protein